MLPIGREEELDRLRAVLDDALAGTASLGWVAGEPGIGKSTLLKGLMDEARSRGFAVLTDRAEEFEAERPFGAIARALGESGRINERPDELSPYIFVDHLQERVEERALEGPVLLGIDDAQWADHWTTQALGVIFRRSAHLPLAVVVLSRPSPRTPHLEELRSSLWHEAAFITLDPLDDQDAYELIASRGDVPGPRLHSYLARAGGNPFFLLELFDALDRDGALTRSRGEVELKVERTPPSLLVAIIHRLQALPTEAHAVLRPAAILGGSFTMSELQAVSGRQLDELISLIDLLRKHGVMTENEDKIAFRHDLIREAIYHDIGGAVAKAMHRRAAEGLGERDPIIAAHHLAIGAERGDLEAAERLFAAADHPSLHSTDAIRFLERGLEILTNASEHWRRRLQLGALLSQANRPEGRSILEQLEVDRTDPLERFQVLTELRLAAIWSGDDHSKWDKDITALAVDSQDSEDPVLLLTVAQARFNSGDRQGALEIATRAANLAAEMKNGPLVSAAENQCAWLLCSLGRPFEAIERSDKAFAHPVPRRAEAIRRFHRGAALFDADRLDEAEEQLRLARQLAETTGLYPFILKSLMKEAQISTARGALAEARAVAGTARTFASEFDLAVDSQDPESIEIEVALATGGPEAARAVASADPAWSQSQVARMLLSAALGDAADAIERAHRIIDSAWAGHWGSWEMVPEAVEVALRYNEELAASALGALAKSESSMNSPAFLSAIAHARARVENNLDAGRQAVVLAEKSPRLLLRAKTFEAMAPVLKENRKELLASSLEIYRSIDADWYAERVATAMGTRVGRSIRPTHGWDALTDSERPVVELAAEGLTNKQIGERLFISHRTVATHLAHAFDKLGLRSRVELAKAVAERGGGGK